MKALIQPLEDGGQNDFKDFKSSKSDD
jgi:hypothetical protein